MNMNWERIWITSAIALIFFGVILLICAEGQPDVKLDVVCVEWLDAKGETGWMTVEDYDPIATMITCGHLVQDNERFIILALDRAMDEDDPVTYNQIGSVPKGMVQRTWKLQ